MFCSLVGNLLYALLDTANKATRNRRQTLEKCDMSIKQCDEISRNFVTDAWTIIR